MLRMCRYLYLKKIIYNGKAKHDYFNFGSDYECECSAYAKWVKKVLSKYGPGQSARSNDTFTPYSGSDLKRMVNTLSDCHFLPQEAYARHAKVCACVCVCVCVRVCVCGCCCCGESRGRACCWVSDLIVMLNACCVCRQGHSRI